MCKIVVPLLAAAAFIASSQTAQATNIPPGTAPPGIPIASGSLAGLTLEGTINGSFSNAAIAGTTQAQVYLDPDGAYDFTLQVTSVTRGTLGGISTFNYSGFITDVYDVSTGGVPFPTAYRSTAGDTVGAVSAINAGQMSDILLIKTDATHFDALGNMGLTGGITGNTAAFEPLAVVPEPASLVLLTGCIVGLGGAACYRRLKKRSIAG
jgi:hypothetical protein